jgi:hypothetical protein
MLEGLRRFFRTKAGQVTAVALTAVALVLAVISVRANLGGSSTAFARERVFICAETKKPYEYELVAGSRIPAPSPFSGKDTGYPAELCYWTKDGKTKEEPTPVLLNRYLGKSDPTFCPDCGRLVVGHNPMPRPGAQPPPTQAEYKPRSGQPERG